MCVQLMRYITTCMFFFFKKSLIMRHNRNTRNYGDIGARLGQERGAKHHGYYNLNLETNNKRSIFASIEN